MDNTNRNSLPLFSSFKRLGNFPIDESSIFANKTEIDAYARSGKAYLGQIVFNKDTSLLYYYKDNQFVELKSGGSSEDQDNGLTIDNLKDYITVDGENRVTFYDKVTLNPSISTEDAGELEISSNQNKNVTVKTMKSYINTYMDSYFGDIIEDLDSVLNGKQGG